MSSCSMHDQCDPRTFHRSCAERPGSYRACVWIDRQDYLLGLGQAHYTVETVTCPGFKPHCRETLGRASCQAK